MKPIPTLTANDLVLLSDVLDAGSFAAAARLSGVTRASLSLRVKSIEARSGVQVFRRSTHALVPTSAGRLLCERGSAIRELTLTAEAGVQQQTGQLSGGVHVCLPTGYGFAVVKSWLFEFSQRHPGVVLRVTMENGMDDLVGRNVDVSVRVATTPAEDVIATKILDVSYGLYASMATVQMTGVPQEPAAISALPMLVSDFVGRKGRILAIREGREQWVDVNPRIVTSNFTLIREAIEAGMGWGFLPDYMVAAEARHLVSALDSWRFCAYGSSIFVVRLSERHQSPAAKALADFIVSRALPAEVS